jgi:hypothetical protein
MKYAFIRAVIVLRPIPRHGNLGHLRGAEHRPLMTLREKLVKIGARIVRHGR